MAWEIYTSAFPAWEQRTLARHSALLGKPEYCFNVFLSVDGRVAGFTGSWDLASCIYLEHMAVSPELRGQGTGSAMLKQFLDGVEKIVILEIDPPGDEISRKRLGFYTSHGFILNEYTHWHPGYKPGDPAHLLLLLSYGRKITEEEFSGFREDLLRTL